VSKDALGEAEEVRPAGVVSEQGDNKGGGIGEGDGRCDGRPTSEGRALQTEEEEDPAKEARNAAALAQFIRGPGGREAGAVLGALGVRWARQRWRVVQWIRARPQEAASRRTMRGRRL